MIGGRIALFGSLLLGFLLAMMASCSRHLEVKADATGTEHASADVATHATETRSEAPVLIETTITRAVEATPTSPARTTTVVRVEHRGEVAVRRELEKDAKALFDGEGEVRTETEKDSRPFGLFAFLGAHLPWLLLAIPVLLVVFRNRLQPLLKLLPFRIPFLSP